MSIIVTLKEYFGKHDASPDATPAIRAAAEELLRKVNLLYETAAADGCDLPDNPKTGSGLSGNGSGGFRPLDSNVGASNSTHKKGRGIDRYDPSRQFAAWCLAHPVALRELGLYMEDPRWTPTWVHLQDLPPRSGVAVYIPSALPPLAAAPDHWSTFA